MKLRHKLVTSLLLALALPFMTCALPNSAAASDKPNVVILATGGTIAGSGAAGKSTNYKPGQLDVDSLINNVQGLSNLANLQGRQICNINSDDITAEHWLNIAKTINELAKDNAVDGFVITHGTDTMDETAYFLNLTVKTDKPVVLTGSMRPATAISADGPMNLYQAVALAGSKEAKGKGVLVLFSDGIYGGRDVQKVNTHMTAAFTEKDLGSLGYMVDEKPYFLKQSTKTHTKGTEFDVKNISELPKVEIAHFHVDADPGVLHYYANSGVKGIIIAGAGAGEYSKDWDKAIVELQNSGIPVIRCSRIANGFISRNDAFGGNTTEGGDLAPHKAAILLRLALTKTNDIKEISRMIATY